MYNSIVANSSFISIEYGLNIYFDNEILEIDIQKKLRNLKKYMIKYYQNIIMKMLKNI